MVFVAPALNPCHHGSMRAQMVMLLIANMVPHTGTTLPALSKCKMRASSHQGAHGVVVSHPLSMREALGSIPSVSISCALQQAAATMYSNPAGHMAIYRRIFLLQFLI